MTKYYLSLFISIVSNSASLILLKKGLLHNPEFSENIFRASTWFSLMMDIYIVSAVVLFGFSFITWMYALTRIDLSLAYPTISLSYVIIALSSHYLFQECVTVYRGAGMAIIVIGVIVMYYK